MRVKYLYLDATDCRGEAGAFAGPTPLACVLSSLGFVALSVILALYLGGAGH